MQEKVNTVIQYEKGTILEENGSYYKVLSSRKPLPIELEENEVFTGFMTVIEKLELKQ